MLHWLEQAYLTSADSVRYSPTARQMTADALDHGGALISRRSQLQNVTAVAVAEARGSVLPIEPVGESRLCRDVLGTRIP